MWTHMECGCQMAGDAMIHWVGRMQGRRAAACNKFWGAQMMNPCEPWSWQATETSVGSSGESSWLERIDPELSLF